MSTLNAHTQCHVHYYRYAVVGLGITEYEAGDVIVAYSHRTRFNSTARSITGALFVGNTTALTSIYMNNVHDRVVSVVHALTAYTCV